MCVVALVALSGCENRIKILQRAKKCYNQDDFEGVETVGLTAGASTPDDIIKKVEEVLKQF